MARAPRIEYPGALYHVITRGNQRQKTFLDDKDREKYLDVLKLLRKAYGFRLYAYVLMANHVHLLIEAGRIPLSRVMQRLGSSYTQYFNRRHRLTGHLFQGRYKAILCDKESYLLELTRYVHLNPVRVKAIEDPGKYRWSSYRAYLGKATEGDLVDVEEVLGQFGRSGAEARERYRRFVLDGIGEGHRAEYYEAVEGRILGEPEFVEEVKQRSGEKKESKLKLKPQAFLERACKALGKRPEEIVGAAKERGRVRLRQILCYVGRTYTDLQVSALASVLKVDPTCVSRCVAVVEERLGEDKDLRLEVRRLSEDIKYHV